MQTSIASEFWFALQSSAAAKDETNRKPERAIGLRIILTITSSPLVARAAVLVLVKHKTDKSDRRQDRPDNHEPMRVLHRLESSVTSSPQPYDANWLEVYGVSAHEQSAAIEANGDPAVNAAFDNFACFTLQRLFCAGLRQ
jgi:hypothetical protein